MDNLSALLQESVPAGSYSLAWLKQAVDGWMIAGAVEGWSDRTRSDRRWWMDRFAEFLQYHELDFSTPAIRRFLMALQQGTERHCRGPLSPGSMDHVHRILRALCQWLVTEELAPVHLMKRVPPPINRDDRIDPFTIEEVEKLLDAARKTRNGKRDVAILSVFLDTGLRVSELCTLRMTDLHLAEGKLEVRQGKGGKSRVAPLGRRTVKALWDYLKAEHRESAEPVFMSQRGDPCKRNSLRLLMDRLQRATGIHTHCHKFRHTAGVFMLRNGANAFHVKDLLGHAALTMTMKYVKLAESDLLDVHKRTSPMDNLTRSGKDRANR
jgi:integrase/recombinase XerD